MFRDVVFGFGWYVTKLLMTTIVKSIVRKVTAAVDTKREHNDLQDGRESPNKYIYIYIGLAVQMSATKFLHCNDALSIHLFFLSLSRAHAMYFNLARITDRWRDNRHSSIRWQIPRIAISYDEIRAWPEAAYINKNCAPVYFTWQKCDEFFVVCAKLRQV